MKKDLEFNSTSLIIEKIGTDNISKEKELITHEFNLWQELIKLNDGNEFTIGHIDIYSTSEYGINGANRFIKLGDKMYDLMLYRESGSSRVFRIYNFEKGWLAPLNIKITKDMNHKIFCNLNHAIVFSISVV